MESTVEKRRKHLTILLIPDDDTEPFSFNISIRILKILGVLSIVLLLHMIIGGLFYWRYAVLNDENNQLEQQNVELKKTRDQIYQLLPKVSELQKTNNRLMNALGISRNAYPFSHTNPLEAKQPIESIEGANSENGDVPILNGPQAQGLEFREERKNSDYHDFVKNIPTMLPVAGYVSQEFNSLKWYSAEKQKSHLGIDIVAEINTPVLAAGDGFVVFSNWTYEMGNQIIIYHGSGFFSYYGHLARNLVVEKTPVRKGEVIGWLGNSGYITSGPHLHFEIWRNGNPVDPKKILLAFQ